MIHQVWIFVNSGSWLHVGNALWGKSVGSVYSYAIGNAVPTSVKQTLCIAYKIHVVKVSVIAHLWWSLRKD